LEKNNTGDISLPAPNTGPESYPQHVDLTKVISEAVAAGLAPVVAEVRNLRQPAPQGQSLINFLLSDEEKTFESIDKLGLAEFGKNWTKIQDEMAMLYWPNKKVELIKSIYRADLITGIAASVGYVGMAAVLSYAIGVFINNETLKKPVVLISQKVLGV
jgi:hypothetical protein